MKTLLVTEPGRISLVIDVPGKARKDRDVLAAMTRFADAPCWMLVDVRLTKYMSPNPYVAGLPGEYYATYFKPESPEEAEFAKSKLREYREESDGTLVWCTYEGIVKGTPEVDGYTPPGVNHNGGYFSKRDGMARLLEIQKFWTTFEGGDFRIENPFRQPTETSMRFECYSHREENRAPRKLRP